MVIYLITLEIVGKELFMNFLRRVGLRKNGPVLCINVIIYSD